MLSQDEQAQVADYKKRPSVVDDKSTKMEANQHQREELSGSSSGLPSVRQKRSIGSVGLEEYNYRVAVESWDQIGSLASEVSSSVLSQMARSMSDQMREENELSMRRKKRKTSSPSAGRKPSLNSEPNLVSSDEEASNEACESNIPSSLTHKIDRMARMSKYMMQIERYHRLLKDEMLSMTEEETHKN